MVAYLSIKSSEYKEPPSSPDEKDWELLRGWNLRGMQDPKRDFGLSNLERAWVYALCGGVGGS